jgi:Alginate export
VFSSRLTNRNPAGRVRHASACAVILAASLLGAVSASAQAPAQPEGGAKAAPVLPSWMQLHGEVRLRYETLDTRYRPTEVGGDQQLDFRTRFQIRLTARNFWLYSETQDSRIALDDSASTVNSSHELGTKALQLYGGASWKDLGSRKLSFQVEGGRLTRDWGARRLVARNIYRNTTTPFDGVLARVGGKAWSLQALASRPVYYTYPDMERDHRFDSELFGGLYFTTTARRPLSGDAYVLVLSDGHTVPLALRRRFDTPGFRLFGQVGPGRRVEYEAETAVQVGTLGPLTHRAWFNHSQLGYSWPDARLRPRLLAMWDYASGDRDPTDTNSGAFDALFGDRRAELGPIGIFGIVSRSNLNSPAVHLFLRRGTAADFSVQLRGVWLAEARDRWRPANLWDPTGRAGTHVGTQADFRLRYRVGPHFEFDGGLTLFDEGAFVRALKPSPNGRATFVYLATEFKF